MSRHIPAAVKRAVWRRDAGRCAFVGDAGRCTETGCLEYHHVVPFAEGGTAVVSNIELRCRAHNAHEAERWFGPLLVREEPLIYTGSLGPDPVNQFARHSIPGAHAFGPPAPRQLHDVGGPGASPS
jgi:5-methylcytosine-specific restriction endonuclease McrA